MTTPIATPPDDPAAEEATSTPSASPRTDQDSTTSRPVSPLPTTPTRVGPDSGPSASNPTSVPGGAGTANPIRPAQPGTTPSTPTTSTPAKPADGRADATKADAAKPDAAKPEAAKSDSKGEAKPDAADAVSPVDNAALNNLASLGPSLAGPLLNSALGMPAAALQGAGQLIPGIASAVMPTLASLLGQLGTAPTPAAPASRLSGYPATVAAGPMSSLAGSGSAADQARQTSAAAAQRVNVLRRIEQQLGDVLGMSSAKTEDARRAMAGVIYDVETAIESAAVQGNTPEAQAAVLTAMRQALDRAGSVVSGAARDKLTDATFVRQLIKEYLSGTAAGSGGAADYLMAGPRGAGRGANAVAAARRYLGTPYVWGGGGAYGPTKGGFDCSGLTQYAVAKATGGRMILPRTTYEQIRCGQAVPLTALRPGDLVFSNFSAPGVPEHVQLYVGGGQVIEAPQRGAPVQISALPSHAQARRVL